MRRLVPALPAPDNADPIGELNVTPLIDVLLVLLVMFILLVPTMTHKVPIDLPQGSDAAPPPMTHRLELTREGALRLDGAGVSVNALPGRLEAIADQPDATLVLRTNPATRYERFDQTIAAVKRAGVTRLGFEGNAEMVK